MNEPDFRSIQNTWRNADTEPIRRDFAGKRRRARFTVFAELVGVVWVFSASAFFLSQDARAVTVVLAVFCITYVTVSVAYGWFQRLRVSEELSRPTLDFAHALTAHHKLEVKLHQVGRSGLRLVTVFSVIWVPWKLAADWDVYVRHPLNAAVGAGGVCLILVALYIAEARTGARLQREGDRLSALHTSLEA